MVVRVVATKSYIVFYGKAPVAFVPAITSHRIKDEHGLQALKTNLAFVLKWEGYALTYAENQCSEEPGLPCIADWLDSMKEG